MFEGLRKLFKALCMRDKCADEDANPGRDEDKDRIARSFFEEQDDDRCVCKSDVGKISFREILDEILDRVIAGEVREAENLAREYGRKTGLRVRLSAEFDGGRPIAATIVINDLYFDYTFDEDAGEDAELMEDAGELEMQEPGRRGSIGVPYIQ